MQKYDIERYRELESRDIYIYIYREGRYILFKVFGSLVPGYYHLKADPSIVFFDGEVSISIGGRRGAERGISFQSILDLQRVCIIHNGGGERRGEGDLLFKANPDADLILRQFVRDNSIVETGVYLLMLRFRCTQHLHYVLIRGAISQRFVYKTRTNNPYRCALIN